MAVWPASLPQEPEVGKWKEKLTSKLLRTEMDSGAVRVRPKYTGEVWAYEVSYQLYYTQCRVLKNFVRYDLNHGVDYFDFPHPGDNSEILSVRFVEMPTYDHLGANVYRVQFTVETESLTEPPGLG
jgi:hypothetical protein